MHYGAILAKLSGEVCFGDGSDVTERKFTESVEASASIKQRGVKFCEGEADRGKGLRAFSTHLPHVLL